MKAFSFPLEPVLMYRRRIEDERRRAFGNAQRSVQEQERQIGELLVLLTAAKSEMTMLATGTLSMTDVAAQQRVIRGLEWRLGAARAELPVRIVKLETARTELIRATQDREAMEKLRERRHREWKYAAATEEQKRLDEVASVHAVRRLLHESPEGGDGGDA